MYRRLIILSLIIVLAIGALALLGYHSITIWSQGLEGARLAQFAEVAEQVRTDVKHKLDEFMQQEQNRPYTDYQPYSVAGISGPSPQQQPLVVSPLADKIENNFAFGNFEVEPDGSIITPYRLPDSYASAGQIDEQLKAHIENIKNNLLPRLGAGTTSAQDAWRQLTPPPAINTKPPASQGPSVETAQEDQKLAQTAKRRQAKYEIESIQRQEQKAQVIEQPREVASSNLAYRAQLAVQQRQEEVAAAGPPDAVQQPVGSAESDKMPAQQPTPERPVSEVSTVSGAQGVAEAGAPALRSAERQAGNTVTQLFQKTNDSEGTVQIRIEPFVPLVIPEKGKDSMFAGQVFLLRHVQIGSEHLLQGFQLNENRLIEAIRASARRFIREGMDFRLGRNVAADAAYSATLDFGFGAVTLNLIETDPGWIVAQTGKLRTWYFSIVAVIVIVTVLVIFSLYRAMRAQVKLTEQKDDFISAVSHELRTPLTSIRMYAEMLEKDWVKSQDKTRQYYRAMRQESERLSRLIENVLDFSRIQKGRKQYLFTMGDLNDCVKNVVEVMRSYAAEAGFTIELDLAKLAPMTFDSDAVTQIVVNLLDNAVKYAGNADDKTIIVRTFRQGHLAVIEVEDHGPGIPHKLQDKVFDVFYRCEAEATRQTKGTGLGLALVSKFAQAHNGFAELLTAKPHGAIFRISLAVQA
jgi:signal transduction histidine kinase